MAYVRRVCFKSPVASWTRGRRRREIYATMVETGVLCDRAEHMQRNFAVWQLIRYDLAGENRTGEVHSFHLQSSCVKPNAAHSSIMNSYYPVEVFLNLRPMWSCRCGTSSIPTDCLSKHDIGCHRIYDRVFNKGNLGSGIRNNDVARDVLTDPAIFMTRV